MPLHSVLRMKDDKLMPAAASEDARPGVLFLSGAGPQERHGFVPGQSIDVGSHEIHDALARAGFVVLRLDDRRLVLSSDGLAPFGPLVETVTP